MPLIFFFFKDVVISTALDFYLPEIEFKFVSIYLVK